MATVMRVGRFSHHFVVTGHDAAGKQALTGFCVRHLGQMQVMRKWDGTYERQLTKIYAAATRDRREFRFHINCYDAFLLWMKDRGFKDNNFDVQDHPLYEPTPATFTDYSGTEPRDYQLPIIDYVANNDAKSKLVILQTGKGKTLISLKAMVRMGLRGLIVLKPMYLDRWLSDLKHHGSGKKAKPTFLGLKPGELIVVKGGEQLKTLLNLAIADKLDKCKIVVISNATLRNYLEWYETGAGATEYPCPPQEMCERLGIGWRLIDEIHQDFHFNFRLDLYTNCPKVIALSATMKHDNETVNKMYRVAYPEADRFDGLEFDRYAEAFELVYSLKHPSPLKWKQRGMTSYSHVAYEDSLMKNKAQLKNYTEMIVRWTKTAFLDIMQPGQKLLIFVATVDYACRLVRALQDTYGYLGLQIGKYTAENEYSELLLNDISVSTLLSSGTAVDIPGLRIALMTTALSSMQLNLQAFGRLRRLKDWPDVIPRFYYLTCEDIPKHVEYANKKKEVFKPVALAQKTMWLRESI